MSNKGVYKNAYPDKYIEDITFKLLDLLSDAISNNIVKIFNHNLIFIEMAWKWKNNAVSKASKMKTRLVENKRVSFLNRLKFWIEFGVLS